MPIEWYIGMLGLLFTAILTFLIASLFGYVVHRGLHQYWAGRFNKAHMTHHLSLYPPNQFLSDEYRSAGKDDSFRTFLLMAIPLIVLPCLLLLLKFITLGMMITAMVMMGIIGFLHSYLHDAFHIRNHFLERLPLLGKAFENWRRLHYLHHINLQTNFGIFCFWWDRLLKTFWNE